MSWKVGIWNQGVDGESDDGVWISVDVKNGFSAGWSGDTEEEFKGVLKSCGYGTRDWFSCWGWFGWWKYNSSHGGDIICWGYCCIEGVDGINSNCCPGSVETCNGCCLLNSCFSWAVVKTLPKMLPKRNILYSNSITSN